MRRAAPWIGGAALALAAALVTAAIPSEDALISPFVDAVGMDEPAQTRYLAVTATEATFADEVSVEDGWSANGNWLVVTIAASARGSEAEATVQLATLVVGDRIFQASERPSTSLRQTPLRIGVATTGQLAFELPSDIEGDSALLRVTSGYITPELDDLAVIEIPLVDAPRVSTVELVEPHWSEQ